MGIDVFPPDPRELEESPDGSELESIVGQRSTRRPSADEAIVSMEVPDVLLDDPDGVQ